MCAFTLGSLIWRQWWWSNSAMMNDYYWGNCFAYIYYISIARSLSLCFPSAWACYALLCNFLSLHRYFIGWWWLCISPGAQPAFANNNNNIINNDDTREHNRHNSTPLSSSSSSAVRFAVVPPFSGMHLHYFVYYIRTLGRFAPFPSLPPICHAIW